MRRLCPTISELNAFHVAAKHLSFTRAARELCVTQGAISRHVAGLEAYLGTPMFLRRSPGLELTEAGLVYLNATLPAISQLETATAQLMSQGGSGGTLNLSVPPTFATHWLFARLPHFKSHVPQVDLNFVRYQHAHDFAATHAFDAAIQYGTGAWPNASARYLIGKETSLVCSPGLQAELKLNNVAQLEHATLLQHVEVPFAWQEWLDAHHGQALNGLFGPRFNQYSLIIRAAVAGFGLGVVPTCLVEDELASGALVEPLTAPAAPRHQSSEGYYLCAPAGHTNLPAFKLFGAWLLQRCEQADRAATPPPQAPPVS
ncbi:MAG: transcriptional regulator, LysR family [Rhodoferax sp.]|nr:transcriptional regulator, LysR family [Rhodoferax sp.]